LPEAKASAARAKDIDREKVQGIVQEAAEKIGDLLLRAQAKKTWTDILANAGTEAHKLYT
jgi:uncharacterized protein YpuA (DUF1002 family)